MQAAVVRRYGGPEVLSLVDMPPPIVKDHDVRIRIKATTVSSADWRLRSGIFPKGFGIMGRLAVGLRGPRQAILGSEFSGVVDAVGARCDRFKIGDAVMAFVDTALGAHAEYVVMSQTKAIVHKPADLEWEMAAAMSFGGTTALTFLRKANLSRGERILITGSSGCVGSAAVQLARHLGAHVTAMCSQGNRDLVLSIGAEQAVDYASWNAHDVRESYDVVMDCVGVLDVPLALELLRPKGRLAMVAANLPQMLSIPWRRLRSGHRLISTMALGSASDLQLLGELWRSGHYRPVIGRTYPFADIAEAHRHVESGHKRGNVVLTMP